MSLLSACHLLLRGAEVSSFAIGVSPLRTSIGTGRSCLTSSPKSSEDGERERESDRGTTGGMATANPLYGLGRIEHVLESPDDKRLTADENEARRRSKVQTWERALASTDLHWGDRRAVSDVPVWATPRVLDGGFASGELLAALRDEDVPNAHYLTGPGLLELDDLLHSGCYRVRVPEHGALLVLSWLLNNDRADVAADILRRISPYFDRLRFYPDKADTPLVVADKTSLFVSSVGEVKAEIQSMIKLEANVNVPRMRAKIANRKALEDWLPLKWKLLSLWMETRGGDSIPAKRFPPDWSARAASLLAEFQRLEERDDVTNSGRTRKGSTKIMISCIEKYLGAGGEALADKDRQHLQNILMGTAEKHGLPGSTEFRAFQSELQSSFPTNHTPQLMNLIDRLEKKDPEKGLDQQTIDEIVTNVPEMVHSSLRRATVGSLDELTELGVIPSSESLAKLVPRLMAQSVNIDAPNEALVRLGYALDCAFSNRRSVILFNLQSQVRFDELPWAEPLLQYRKKGQHDNALSTLKFITETTVRGFPQTIIPNKMLQSMRSLAKRSGKDLYLTDELATDIFMGAFSDKFDKSAHLAAKLLAGSVYERYFGLDYGKIAKMDAPLSTLLECDQYQPHHTIEVQQIITTHNLAALFSVLELELDGREMVLKVWDWILAELSKDSYNASTCKNVAYAWRQLLFFASVAADTDGLVGILRERLRDEIFDDELKCSIEKLFLTQLYMALCGENPQTVLLGNTFRESLIGESAICISVQFWTRFSNGLKP